MEEFMHYLVRSILVSALLSIYYLIFLRNKKFNEYNRYYLLMALMASLFIPLLNLDFYNINQPQNSLSVYFLNTLANKEETGMVRDSGFHWGWLLLFLALLISVFMLASLLIKITKVLSLTKKYPSTKLDGIELHMTDLEQAPFSFWNHVFWNQRLDLQSEEGILILEHERVHINEKHSYDKIAVQLAICIFWFNPFFWFISKELGLIHEFIADKGSFGEGNTVTFARMLLRSHDSGRYPDIENSFFHTPIKRRLTMIAQTKSAPFSYLRRIAILPLSLLLIFMISFTISNAQNEPDTAKLRKLESEAKQDPFKQMEPQSRAITDTELREMIQNILSNPPADRKFFINGKQVQAEKIKKLKFDMISDIQLLAPEDAMKHFGVSGQKGAISFLLKKKNAS